MGDIEAVVAGELLELRAEPIQTVRNKKMKKGFNGEGPNGRVDFRPAPSKT